ncbi:MAG: GTP-binding protein, partial [Desulfohalobium sp.]
MSKPKERYLETLRNIGIIAHIDAGKTTLTERILYYTKRIHRMGEVHEGTATMDYMPEEQERGITITSAFTSCQWRDKQIHIIDTPGHVDFTIEVERSLRVLDGAVGVFCAVGGVEPQSETVWHQSERYQIPKLAFVNKMDRVGADFEGVLQAMRERLGARPLALQAPQGQGPEFQGIIDVMRWEFLEFDSQSKGETFAHKPLTPEQEERARPLWEAVVEAAAEEDEELLTAYVEGITLDTARVQRALRALTLAQKVVPVYVGSALKYIGVQPLLDGIRAYLPSPLDVPPAQGLDPVAQSNKSFPVSAESPLSALVFKVTMETGRKLVLARLYSGTIEPGETLYNATQDFEERAARLFTLHAGHKDKLER